MTTTPQVHDPLMLAKAIRRFDVFAEYTRQERRDKGDPADVAKGYGIWLAKVVASRRFGAKTEQDHHAGSHTKDQTGRPPKFRSLGDEPQTDEVFDHDIVDRMGSGFYRKIFVPAIEAARKDGKSYEDIRDVIREEWKRSKTK